MLGVAATLVLMAASYVVVPVRDPRPGTVSVVAFLDTEVPQLWPAVFAAGAVVLVSSVAGGRAHLAACGAATGVLAGYDVALWTGSLGSTPLTSWVTASAVGGLAFVAGGLAASFVRFPVTAR